MEDNYNNTFEFDSDNADNSVKDDISDIDVNDTKSPDNKKKNKDNAGFFKSNRFKIALIIVIVLLIAFLAVYIVSIFKTSEGEKLAREIPIGRDIEYAEKETGIDFTDKSNYESLLKINRFDYVYESKDSVKVSGVVLPEWAVMIADNSQGLIDKVTYYDFSQLQKSWKGHKVSSRIDNNTIKYAMKPYEVKKTIGIEPYYIQTDIDNSTKYVYRYYYVDTDTNNDKVVNLYVVFDVNNCVKTVESKDLSFATYLLSVN